MKKSEQIKFELTFATLQLTSLLLSLLLPKYVKIKMYKTLILPFVLYRCGTSSLTKGSNEGI
jgi:hypothetical protein